MIRLGSLLGEIHRRSVWQVLGSYAVGAWVILQLGETLAGLIGLPLWFGPTLVGLVVAGFPLVLLTVFLQGGRRTGAESGEKVDGPGKALLRKLFSWRNAAIGMAVVVALLGAGTAGWSGMRVAGIGSVGSLQAKGILDEDERLILADFEDRTPDGSLGETVTALFRIDLAQSTSVRVLEAAQLAPALIRMERDPSEALTQDVALELAEREGVKGVVTGEVLPLGAGAVISARLVTSDGETLVAMDQTAKAVSDIPETVDVLSAQIRERIGESLRSIQGDPPLNEVTTSSLEALRKYAQADQANDHGDWERAVTLLEEGLEEDSTFAMAWRKIGVLFQNENRNPERGRMALARAYELRDRLTDRERYLAEAAYFTYVEDDPLRARQAYETVLESYPADRIALNNLAVAYSSMGDEERATSIYLRSIREGTAPAVSYTNAAQTLFGLGQMDSVAFVLDRFAQAFPENPETHRYNSNFAAARFDYVTAEKHVQSLLESQAGNPAWEMQGLSDMAGLSLLKGQPWAGMDYILQVFSRQELLGVDFIPQPRSVFEATVEAAVRSLLFEEHEEVLRILDRGWAQRPLEDVDPVRLGHLQFALLYATSGRPDRARELVALFQEEVDSEAQQGNQEQANLHLVRAEIARVEGRLDESLQETALAREASGDCELCVLPELGEAHAALGNHQEAVDSFQEYLDVKSLFRLSNDNFNLPRVVHGLAKSHEALGNRGEAARHYQWMLDLWYDPHPDLQPKIAEFQEALGRVGG